MVKLSRFEEMTETSLEDEREEPTLDCGWYRDVD
jgi:hypothetical protein